MRYLLATLVCIILLTAKVYAADWKYVNDAWHCDQTGWVQSGGDWYYVSSDNIMVTNQYVDGYYISYTGRMINESPSDREVNKLLYLVKNNQTPTWVFDSSVDDYIASAISHGVTGGLTLTEHEGVTHASYDADKVQQLKKDREYIEQTLEPYVHQLITKPAGERVLEAHNIVCNLLDYSQETNVASGLRSGYGACHVYVVLYKYLLNAAGVDCDYVRGVAAGQDHAWNAVHIGGKEYLVDCCWDDGLGDYTYFMQETMSDRKER